MFFNQIRKLFISLKNQTQFVNPLQLMLMLTEEMERKRYLLIISTLTFIIILFRNTLLLEIGEEFPDFTCMPVKFWQSVFHNFRFLFLHIHNPELLRWMCSSHCFLPGMQQSLMISCSRYRADCRYQSAPALQ